MTRQAVMNTAETNKIDVNIVAKVTLTPCHTAHVACMIMKPEQPNRSAKRRCSDAAFRAQV